MSKLDRAGLIRLVEHIIKSSGCIMDVDALLTQFDNNVPMPEASRMIFDPPDGRRRSAEEIVDFAMAYSPDAKVTDVDEEIVDF